MPRWDIRHQMSVDLGLTFMIEFGDCTGQADAAGGGYDNACTLPDSAEGPDAMMSLCRDG